MISIFISKKLPKTITSASFSVDPELFFIIKVYFPLSPLTARRIVNNVLCSYLSMVILIDYNTRKNIYEIHMYIYDALDIYLYIYYTIRKQN